MNMQSKLSYMGNEIETEGSLPVGCFDSRNLVGILEVLWSSCGAACACSMHVMCSDSVSSLLENVPLCMCLDLYL